MAQYNVTYSCGHTAEVQLYGNHRDRESKIEWMETIADCPTCYRVKMRARREEEHREAAEAAATYLSTRPDLPALTGSPKQIAWADTIRAGILADAERYEMALNHAPQEGESGELTHKLYPIWYSELCARAEATWWIDHRNQSHDEVIGGSNPIAMIGMLDGRTPANTALTLWESWCNARPEVIEYRARMQAEYELEQVEHERLKEEHIKEVLSCLYRVDWEHVDMDSDSDIVSSDGHTIGLSCINMSWIEISTIDGNSQIDFGGEFACWIYQREEVRELGKKLTAMWHAAEQAETK